MASPDLFDWTSSPLSLERSLWSAGLTIVAGVDEAGRGALAGPVVAAAAVFDDTVDDLLPRIRDSKKLTPEHRDELFPLIQERARSVGVGIVHCVEIDRLNILRASLEAMRIAIDQLSLRPELCLIDGNQRVPIALEQRLIVKGDDRVFSIGAASIIAKVSRDRWMDDLDVKYPEYGFRLHKGYGTDLHRAALERIGPCPEHRLSFSLPRRIAS